MSNHIIVTTHLGQLFPFLRFGWEGGIMSRFDDAEPSSDPTICQSSVFDRILFPAAVTARLCGNRDWVMSSAKPPNCG